MLAITGDCMTGDGVPEWGEEWEGLVVSCCDRWLEDCLMRAMASVGNRFNKASTTMQSVRQIVRFDVCFKRHGG
jgi:hypothetical protein